MIDQAILAVLVVIAAGFAIVQGWKNGKLR